MENNKISYDKMMIQEYHQKAQHYIDSKNKTKLYYVGKKVKYNHWKHQDVIFRFVNYYESEFKYWQNGYINATATIINDVTGKRLRVEFHDLVFIN